jgi:hypothetical protein
MAEAWSHDDLFRWFVIQQQQMVMIHLGKLVHPGTGKIERDLEAARMSIDLLGMLEAKTKGNLLADDERLLGQVLTTLRLNFVEELSRPQAPEQGAEAPGSEAQGAEAPSGAPAETAQPETAESQSQTPGTGPGSE